MSLESRRVAELRKKYGFFKKTAAMACGYLDISCFYNSIIGIDEAGYKCIEADFEHFSRYHEPLASYRDYTERKKDELNRRGLGFNPSIFRKPWEQRKAEKKQNEQIAHCISYAEHVAELGEIDRLDVTMLSDREERYLNRLYKEGRE